MAPADTVVIEHRVRAIHTRIDIDDPAWKLAGSAHLAGGGIEIDYGCKADGYAARPLDEVDARGHWIVRIQHVNSECQGLRAYVDRRDTEFMLMKPIAMTRLAANRHAGTAELAFDVARGEPLRLVLVANDGGLHCGGTTRITSVELVHEF